MMSGRSSLWLLDPDVCTWPLEQVLAAGRGGAARARILKTEFGFDVESDDPPEQLYDLVDGVAIIRIYGPLFDDDLILPRLGMSGYGGLMAQYEAAQADPIIKGVFFDINSPGGLAAPALEDLANDIFRGRSTKPSIANVRHFATSAAYWIASAATVVTIPTLGEVGSIGVWTLHLDVSGALEQAGIVPTLIWAGDHKVDGQPFKPLPENVRADWQEEVDALRVRFAEAVGRGRNTSVDALMKTEARLYRGEQARQIGLANVVLPRKEALQTLIDSVA